MAFDKTRFGGVVAPIVNPCGEDDSLDRGALEANLTRLLSLRSSSWAMPDMMVRRSSLSSSSVLMLSF
jgi:hypothetical protein